MDQREEDMLALMRECSQTLRRVENQISEMWAEWTRLHEPTIDRGERKVRRVVKRK